MLERAGGVFGVLFFLWVVVIALARYILEAIKIGTIQLDLGEFRRPVAEPVSRARAPRAFWGIVIWYCLLDIFFAGVVVLMIIGLMFDG